MDPFTAGVMIALGKYAADKAIEAIPVIGAEVTKLLENIYNFVLDSLSEKGSSETVIIDGYKQDPETYEKPLAKMLDREIGENKVFFQKLQTMVDEYNDALKNKGMPETYAINVKGNLTSTGSVFGSGSVHAGGDIIGGNKSGTELK